MKFIDTEIMKKYLQGKADEEEKNKVMTWLMLNLKSPYADKEFEELLEKVPAVTDDARKERVSSRLMTFIAVHLNRCNVHRSRDYDLCPLGHPQGYGPDSRLD